MTKKEAIQKAIDDAADNLFAYSGNYGMTYAKKGYEKEFEECKEYIKRLEEIRDIIIGL